MISIPQSATEKPRPSLAFRYYVLHRDQHSRYRYRPINMMQAWRFALPILGIVLKESGIGRKTDWWDDALQELSLELWQKIEDSYFTATHPGSYFLQVKRLFKQRARTVISGLYDDPIPPGVVQHFNDVGRVSTPEKFLDDLLTDEIARYAEKRVPELMNGFEMPDAEKEAVRKVLKTIVLGYEFTPDMLNGRVRKEHRQRIIDRTTTWIKEAIQELEESPL